MAIEIVDFPINSMVDLSIAMLVHQRVWGILVNMDGGLSYHSPNYIQLSYVNPM